MILLSWPQGRGYVIPFGLTRGVQHETPSHLVVKYFSATKEKNQFRTKECHFNFYGTWSKCTSIELATPKGKKTCNFLYQYYQTIDGNIEPFQLWGVVMIQDQFFIIQTILRSKSFPKDIIDGNFLLSYCFGKWTTFVNIGTSACYVYRVSATYEARHLCGCFRYACGV